AFEYAHAHKELPHWAEQLTFAAQVAGDPRVAALSGNPRISRKELASLFLPHGASADSEFGRFIGLLAENGRLSVLAEISSLFEQLKRHSERSLKGCLPAAVRIGPNELERIRTALKRSFQREVEIRQSIHPKMLGGAIIAAGDV